MSELHLDKRETSVYRLFDANDQLLYVGCSTRVEKRLKDHRRAKTWFGDVARVEIEHFPVRWKALQAEEAAILSEYPLHNKAIPQELRERDPDAPTEEVTIKISLNQWMALLVASHRDNSTMEEHILRGIAAHLANVSPSDAALWNAEVR